MFENKKIGDLISANKCCKKSESLGIPIKEKVFLDQVQEPQDPSPSVNPNKSMMLAPKGQETEDFKTNTSKSWECRKIKIKTETIPRDEFESRLADLLELLLEQKSQFQNPKIAAPVKPMVPPFQYKKGA